MEQMEAADAAADEYVVECYWPGVTLDDVDALDRRAQAVVVATRRPAAAVDFVGSILVPEDEVVLFEFRAGSLETVAEVSRRAGIPFQRIVGAVRRSGKA